MSRSNGEDALVRGRDILWQAIYSMIDPNAECLLRKGQRQQLRQDKAVRLMKFLATGQYDWIDPLNRQPSLVEAHFGGATPSTNLDFVITELVAIALAARVLGQGKIKLFAGGSGTSTSTTGTGTATTTTTTTTATATHRTAVHSIATAFGAGDGAWMLALMDANVNFCKSTPRRDPSHYVAVVCDTVGRIVSGVNHPVEQSMRAAQALNRLLRASATPRSADRYLLTTGDPTTARLLTRTADSGSSMITSMRDAPLPVSVGAVTSRDSRIIRTGRCESTVAAAISAIPRHHG
jgi:hypothetical protein